MRMRTTHQWNLESAALRSRVPSRPKQSWLRGLQRGTDKEFRGDAALSALRRRGETCASILKIQDNKGEIQRTLTNTT